MEMYLLKSAACLAIFFLFYKLILERESFHHFKRFYLLASLTGAFLIPLITFTKYIETQQAIMPLATGDFTIVTTSELAVSTNYLPIILWSLYGIGVVFFSVKFLRNLFSIIQKIRKNPRYKADNFFHVLLNSAVIPHTFFSYIFLNKQKFEANEIPSEVLIHEHAHANQKHSLDILFIELAQIILWFNPIIYLIKRSIRLNHEFLADQVVLRSGATTSEYQKILLAFSSNATVPIMANSINYSSIKKRFTVMKTQTSKRATWLRILIILPILSLVVYGFSSTEIIETPSEDITPIEVFDNLAINEFVSIDTPQQQTSATREEMKEYNRLAKKYNTMSRENMFVEKKDIERLKFIYGKMSSKQRADAEPFPDVPPPAPDAPKPPKANGMDSKMPPPPPPPPAPESPIDHIVSMAKKNATFYYEDEKVSSDKAISLIKKNKSLNIQTIGIHSKNPTVKISKKPITIDKPAPMAISIVDMPLFGPSPDPSDPVKMLNYMTDHGAKVWLDGEIISKEKGMELIKAEKSVRIIKVETPHDIPTVVFGEYGC